MNVFIDDSSSGGSAPGATPNAIAEDHFTHASSGDIAGNVPDTVGSVAWASQSGTISYIGSGVVQTGNGIYALESGYVPTSSHPLTIQVSVRGGSGSYIGLTFRQASGLNYLLFFIYPGGSGWEVDSVTAGNYDPILSGSAVYATSTWYALKIVDDGTNVDFYVNNSVVQHSTSLVLKNTNTQFGLEGGFGTVEYKDFVVTRAP